MAADLLIQPERRLAIVRYSGFVTGRDIVRTIGEMLDHPDWRPGFRRLSSTAKVATMDVTPADLEAMYQQDLAERARVGAGRKAVVVAPQYEVISVMYKHLFERRAGLYELKLFTEEAAAKRWLLDGAAGEGG
jgi:hypothetical protein